MKSVLPLTIWNEKPPGVWLTQPGGTWSLRVMLLSLDDQFQMNTMVPATNGTFSQSWNEVSSSNPCPICGKDGWCKILENGSRIVCRRSNADPADTGYELVRQENDKNGDLYNVWRLIGTGKQKYSEPIFTLQDGNGQRAEPDDLDLVYRTFLSRLATATTWGMKRGFTREEIIDGNYRKLGANRLDAVDYLVKHGLEKHLPTVPGFYVREKDGKRCWSIGGNGDVVFPVCNIDGKIVALKLRNSDAPEGRRYSYISSAKRKWTNASGDEVPGPGPGSQIHFPPFKGDRSIVRITEGELKANIATSRSGVWTLGLPGVGSWKRVAPIIRKLKPNVVRVCFDADFRTKSEVRSALVNLLESMPNSVRVELEIWPIESGKGIDDVWISGKQDTIEIVSGDNLKAFIVELRQTAESEGRNILDQSGASTAGCEPDGLSDVGNAERLVQKYGHHIRYCEAWKKWVVWDGKRWEVGADGRVIRMAIDTVRDMYREAAGSEDKGERAALLKWAQTSESASRIEAMVKLARAMVPVRHTDFDRDSWAFNVQNGTIDLRSGKLRPHNPADLITKLCPIEYDPNAECPRWEEFQRQIHNADDGSPFLSFKQRMYGYFLTGDVREQILPIYYGTGANGKSLEVEMMLYVFGPDYSGKAPRDFLTQSGNDRHPTELADLFGKRFVVATETDDGKRLSEGLVKELSGSDSIRARRMREDFWEFQPTHKLVLVTNHKPRVFGTDNGIWRRLVLVPYDQRFWNEEAGESGPPDRKQDKMLGEKLRQEAPGILAWTVRGCLEWQRIGLQVPNEVRDSTAEYRRSEDILSEFIEERFTVLPELSTRAKDIIRSYKAWAEQNGQPELSGRKIGDYLAARGFTKRKSNGAVWHGLGLKVESNEDSEH